MQLLTGVPAAIPNHGWSEFDTKDRSFVSKVLCLRPKFCFQGAILKTEVLFPRCYTTDRSFDSKVLY
jgi:hypothetical protein